VHLDATEHKDGIVFLHAVKEGPANRSHGLAVAQLAGVPREVIAAAREYLEALERGRTAHPGAATNGSHGGHATGLSAAHSAAARSARSRHDRQVALPLEPAAPPPVDPRLQELAAAVRAAEPDQIAPRDALDLVYKLKKLLD
jgi:DNA mismatch repair protein MutS